MFYVFQIGHEESMLREWLDCCITDGGTLVAKQRLGKPPHLVSQMVDEWLQRYQSLAQMVHSSSDSTASVQSRTAQLALSSTANNLSSDDDTDDE